MNVLILTPDRVGSTLLQRLITIYMLRRDFGRPVINLHELTNGLEKYYNPTLNQEVLGKPKGTDWGYYQSLAEIEGLLKSVDHWKTSRLAHYHIVRRKDSLPDQIKFYEYLNDNFFIIGCRRENLFEHVLSWVINSHSKHLNVYSALQKVNVFNDLYRNGITANQETITNYSEKYKQYIEWSDQYFNVQSYFNYEADVHNIEEYILNLDFMSGHKNNSWQDMFGQNFKDWNACHRLLPNIMLENRMSGPTLAITENVLENNHQLSPEASWDTMRGADWPLTYSDYLLNQKTLPVAIQTEIEKCYNLSANIRVTDQEHKFLEQNLRPYEQSLRQISDLTKNGFMVTGVPIKLQSLKEKKLIIKNFDQCIEWYNEWVDKNNFGKKYQPEELLALSAKEEEVLNNPVTELRLTSDKQSTTDHLRLS